MTAFSINPDIIPWACERLDMTLAEFAREIHVSEHVMEGWKNGAKKPSLSQARKMADKLLIPLGYLVLKKMPRITLDAVDFRTVGNRRVIEPSLELWATYNMALSRQEWYRDCAIENEYERCRCVGSITPKTPVKEAAEAIRTTLGALEQPQNARKTWENRFNGLVNAIEDKAGIMVMRNSMVGNNSHKPLSVEEFRGFAISDEYAPLIFINSKDSKNAQLFTLLHELVHVFLGRGGISGQDYLNGSENALEQYCNQVAAEYLVPAEELLQTWREDDGGRSLDDKIKRLASEHQVSAMVMIIRCQSLGLIDRQQAGDLWQKEIKAIQIQKSNRRGMGKPYAVIANRVSRLFARSIIWQLETMRIQPEDAFRLLNVKNDKAMRQLANEVGVF